jgi:hypothetical protein
MRLNDSITCWAKRWLTLFACLFVVSIQPVIGAQSRGSAPTGTAITAIRLERNCFGCSDGSVLILQRDGTATVTTTGSARFGTTDRTARGRVTEKDFAELVGVLTMQRFFQLNDEYADPQLQDGTWLAVTVTRGGQEKVVRQRNDAGPPALGAIVRAIDAVRARITWRPDSP